MLLVGVLWLWNCVAVHSKYSKIDYFYHICVKVDSHHHRRLSPGSPGSRDAWVTSGVIIRECDWQRITLVVTESTEEKIHYWGELFRYLVPLLWILFYVKQHYRLQRLLLGSIGAVLARSGEPVGTTWRKCGTWTFESAEIKEWACARACFWVWAIEWNTFNQNEDTASAPPSD